MADGLNIVSAKRRRAIAGRVVLAVLAVVLCAVIPVFLNDFIGYLPLLALVCVMAVSFVYLQVLKRSLTFDATSLVPTCERGQNIDFVVKFENTSPLVFPRIEVLVYISDLFGKADVVQPVSMVLMPHEQRDFSFEAQFDHIGTYSAGIAQITVSDVLGLFFHTIRNDDIHTVEVLPRLVDIDSVSLTSTATSDSRRARQTLTADDMDYAGVREYVWGDPLKTIHWKLSSRQTDGDYLTRLFEAYSNPGACILVDTSTPQYTTEELMCLYDTLMESALSLNRYAMAQGLDVVVEFVDKTHQKRRAQLRSEWDFPQIASAVLPVHVGEGVEFLDMFEQEGKSLHGQDNIIVCTSHVSERIVTGLLQLRLRKKNPLLVVAVPPHADPEDVRRFTAPLRRLAADGVGYAVVSDAKELAGEVAL